MEINTGQLGNFYQVCLRNFQESLAEAPGGLEIFKEIQEQSNFRDILKALNTRIRPKRRVDDKKVALFCLKSLI